MSQQQQEQQQQISPNEPSPGVKLAATMLERFDRELEAAAKELGCTVKDLEITKAFKCPDSGGGITFEAVVTRKK